MFEVSRRTYTSEVAPSGVGGVGVRMQVVHEERRVRENNQEKGEADFDRNAPMVDELRGGL